MAGELILAVDDSATILAMLRAILVQGGYEVVTAGDGAEALDVARSSVPDLILLDVMLPKLDGYKVCRLLKFDKKYKHIPIVMLSARAEDAAMATGIRTGADRYLTKPVGPDELLDTVGGVIARSRQET